MEFILGVACLYILFHVGKWLFNWSQTESGKGCLFGIVFIVVINICVVIAMGMGHYLPVLFGAVWMAYVRNEAYLIPICVSAVIGGYFGGLDGAGITAIFVAIILAAFGKAIEDFFS